MASWAVHGGIAVVNSVVRRSSADPDPADAVPAPRADFHATSTTVADASGCVRKTFWLHKVHYEALVFAADAVTRGGADAADAAAAGDAASPERVLFIIPGNPGHPAFYEDVARRVFEATGRSVHVVVCGFPSHSRRSAAAQPRRRFTLAQQVHHQLQAVQWLLRGTRDIVPLRTAAPQVMLAGHSIGAYTCVQLLQREPALHGAILLFPTLSDMVRTPNGVRMWSLLRYYQRAAAALASVLAVLPAPMQAWVGRRAVGPDAWDRHQFVRDAGASGARCSCCCPRLTLGLGVSRAVSGLMHGDVAGNALHMADFEMREVTSHPSELLEALQHRLAFVYGACRCRALCCCVSLVR